MNDKIYDDENTRYTACGFSFVAIGDVLLDILVCLAVLAVT